MTLRKTHVANLERSPTVFPNAKMSTFEDAPSAEKRKILDEGDRRSQEERAKLDKRTPSRGGGSSSTTTSPTRSTHRLARTMAKSVYCFGEEAWPRAHEKAGGCGHTFQDHEGGARPRHQLHRLMRPPVVRVCLWMLREPASEGSGGATNAD